MAMSFVNAISKINVTRTVKEGEPIVKLLKAAINNGAEVVVPKAKPVVNFLSKGPKASRQVGLNSEGAIEAAYNGKRKLVPLAQYSGVPNLDYKSINLIVRANKHIAKIDGDIIEVERRIEENAGNSTAVELLQRQLKALKGRREALETEVECIRAYKKPIYPVNINRTEGKLEETLLKLEHDFTAMA